MFLTNCKAKVLYTGAIHLRGEGSPQWCHFVTLTPLAHLRIGRQPRCGRRKRGRSDQGSVRRCGSPGLAALTRTPVRMALWRVGPALGRASHHQALLRSAALREGDPPSAAAHTMLASSLHPAQLPWGLPPRPRSLSGGSPTALAERQSQAKPREEGASPGGQGRGMPELALNLHALPGCLSTPAGRQLSLQRGGSQQGSGSASRVGGTMGQLLICSGSGHSVREPRDG